MLLIIKTKFLIAKLLKAFIVTSFLHQNGYKDPKYHQEILIAV